MKLCVGIELGLLRRLVRESRNGGISPIMTIDGDRPLSVRAALKAIRKRELEGYKVWPCEHADATGRCQGW